MIPATATSVGRHSPNAEANRDDDHRAGADFAREVLPVNRRPRCACPSINQQDD